MSDPNESAAHPFGEMIRRLAEGLQGRVEASVEATAGEAVVVDRSGIAEELVGGALVGRTAWTADGNERSGCFLWTGSLGGLLGGEEKTPDQLGDAEQQALAQSLELNVGEGGEGEMTLTWTPLEVVAAEGLPECLRECGIPESSQAERFTLRIGEAELAFLFFSAPAEESATDAPDPVDPGQVPAAGLAAQAAPVELQGPPDPAQLEDMLELPLSLTIRLGSTRMSLEEILRLIPGSVVELDQREEEPLEVLANGRVVARGEVVVVDDRFGLRVTEIVRGEDRVAAAT